MLFRRIWITSAVAALSAVCALATAPALAQPRDLVLAISEGTSGGLDHSRVIAKYGGFTNILGSAIKRRVVVVFVREFSQLEDGIKTGKFDFVMARPSDYPARAIRDNGFRYVAHAKPDGQCFIIVPKNSPIKTLADAKGKRWVMPEKVSYMSKFCTAELRDRGIDLTKENVTHVREQALIGSYLDTNTADVGGVASYSGLARDWAKAGNPVLHRSISQPFSPLVAAKTITPKQVEAIQKQLTNIETAEGGADALKSMAIAGFDITGTQRVQELLVWLEKSR